MPLRYSSAVISDMTCLVLISIQETLDFLVIFMFHHRFQLESGINIIKNTHMEAEHLSRLFPSNICEAISKATYNQLQKTSYLLHGKIGGDCLNCFYHISMSKFFDTAKSTDKPLSVL